MKKVALIILLCGSLIGCANKNSAILDASFDVVAPTLSTNINDGGETELDDEHIVIENNDDTYIDTSLDFTEAKQLLQSCVFVGDSRLYGFVENNIQQKDKIIYTRKEKVSWGKDQIGKIKLQNPSAVIISFGLIDLDKSTSSRYSSDLKSLIKKIQKEIPDIPIVCVDIIRPSTQAVLVNSKYGKSGNFNSAARTKLAKLDNVYFVNVSKEMKDEYYEDDGLHLKGDFYKYWTIGLAECIKDKQ